MIYFKQCRTTIIVMIAWLTVMLLVFDGAFSFSVVPSAAPFLRSPITTRRTTTRLQETPYFPTSNNNNDVNNDDQNNNDSNDENNNKTGRRQRRTKSFWQAIDEVGMDLKSRAASANAKAKLQVDNKARKIRYLVQSCLLYTLFILYRAYRGFFVIIPIVFRETFRKLETAVDEDPFEYDNNNNNNNEQPASSSMVNKDSDEESFKWRTRITISVLATVLTASYVLGGAVRVFIQLVRSLFRKGGNLVQSFSDAAELQERNEEKIVQRFQKKKEPKKNNNGWSDFAP